MMPYGLLGEDPRLWATRAPAPLMVPQTPPVAPRPTIWDRLRVGGERLFGIPQDAGLLAPEDRSLALRQGLLSAGAAVANSDPSQGILHGLVQGVAAGRGGAMSGIEQQDALIARQAGFAQREKRLQFQQKYLGANTSDRQVLMSMLRDAVALGLQHEGTQLASALSGMGAENPMRNRDPNSPEVLAAKLQSQKDLATWARENGYQVAYNAQGDATLVPTSPDRPAVPVPGGKAAGKPMASQGTTNVLAGKVRTGAQNALQALEEADQILREDRTADITPVASGIASSAAQSRIADYVPGLKGGAEALAQSQMTTAQQKFQAAMSRFAHNAVGLLPGSRQSIALFNDLRQAYTPKQGQTSQEFRDASRAARTRLAEKMRQLAKGETVSLGDLPGFAGFEYPTGGAETPSATKPKTPFSPGGEHYRP